MVPDTFAFQLENMHPEAECSPHQRAHLLDIKTACLVKQWTQDIAAARLRAV